MRFQILKKFTLLITVLIFFQFIFGEIDTQLERHSDALEFESLRLQPSVDPFIPLRLDIFRDGTDGNERPYGIFIAYLGNGIAIDENLNLFYNPAYDLNLLLKDHYTCKVKMGTKLIHWRTYTKKGNKIYIQQKKSPHGQFYESTVTLTEDSFHITGYMPKDKGYFKKLKHGYFTIFDSGKMTFGTGSPTEPKLVGYMAKTEKGVVVTDNPRVKKFNFIGSFLGDKSGLWGKNWTFQFSNPQKTEILLFKNLGKIFFKKTYLKHNGKSLTIHNTKGFSFKIVKFPNRVVIFNPRGYGKEILFSPDRRTIKIVNHKAFKTYVNWMLEIID